jgi:hypothetical protein
VVILQIYFLLYFIRESMPTLDFRHNPIEKNVISNEPLEITFFYSILIL